MYNLMNSKIVLQPRSLLEFQLLLQYVQLYF